MGKATMLLFMTSFMTSNEMGNRPISSQDVALQIFYASIFYPFANFRQLANDTIMNVGNKFARGATEKILLTLCGTYCKNEPTNSESTSTAIRDCC